MTNKLISLVLIIFFLLIGHSYSESQFLFPKKKPSIFSEDKKNIGQTNIKNLPQRKPIIREKEAKKDNTSKGKKDVKKVEEFKKKVEVVKNKNIFILPQKKPSIYKTSTNEKEKSSILNQKDFDRAKETIQFIKEKKWNSALKSAAKVKDKEFRNLITWMHLKTSRNGASFTEYKNFIEQNGDYPRINRIRYLAEEKIYLRNHSPTSIINWFERYPPLGGIGKIKLAEAHLEKGNTDKVRELIKEGWETAEIRKNDLGYYRAKFKKFIDSEDHVKRADYLAWERKYWDLKRMLKYLPSDQRALYTARQILMSNSYGVDNNGEMFLVNSHIPLYRQSSYNNHDPKGNRKLLLKKKEINKLIGRINQDGLTLIPTKLYFSKGKVKVEIAVAKGKKLYDKRQVKKTRDWNREKARLLSKNNK